MISFDILTLYIALLTYIEVVGINLLPKHTLGQYLPLVEILLMIIDNEF